MRARFPCSCRGGRGTAWSWPRCTRYQVQLFDRQVWQGPNSVKRGFTQHFVNTNALRTTDTAVTRRLTQHATMWNRHSVGGLSEVGAAPHAASARGQARTALAGTASHRAVKFPLDCQHTLLLSPRCASSHPVAHASFLHRSAEAFTVRNYGCWLVQVGYETEFILLEPPPDDPTGLRPVSAGQYCQSRSLDDMSPSTTLIAAQLFVADLRSLIAAATSRVC